MGLESIWAVISNLKIVTTRIKVTVILSVLSNNCVLSLVATGFDNGYP